ncbi:UNVERIFIED_CONTAM: hypothetical protein HDU68_005117, partial [Siphonaria sp. JEL0065]
KQRKDQSRSIGSKSLMGAPGMSEGGSDGDGCVVKAHEQKEGLGRVEMEVSEPKSQTELQATNERTQEESSSAIEEDSIEAQRHALDTLITTIKPLLPRINNHITRSASLAFEAKNIQQTASPQEEKTAFLAMLNSSSSASNANELSSQQQLQQPPTKMPHRKSLKDIFTKSSSVVAPTTDPTPLKAATSAPIVAKPPTETLASAPMSDDTLALALASLCNALYRVLDTIDVNRAPTGMSPSIDSATARTTVEIQELSNHAKEIAELQSLSGNASLSPEQKTLWLEIDKMMALVHTLCLTRCHVLEKPPSYDDHVVATLRRGSMLSMEELHCVAEAIERVIRTAPKMFDQTVTLSARQERMMDEAAITGLIDRLFQGREDFQAQRASPDSYINMNRLVDQIVKSSKRSMDNQRVQLSENYQQKMESAKLLTVVEKQAKTRFKNQDWVSKETQLINELAQLQTNLMTACRGMPNQRVELTDLKEKEMFLGRLVGRMQADSTFDNQTAVSITKKKKDDELDKIMDRISKTSTQLANQQFAKKKKLFNSNGQGQEKGERSKNEKQEKKKDKTTTKLQTKVKQKQPKQFEEEEEDIDQILSNFQKELEAKEAVIEEHCQDDPVAPLLQIQTTWMNSSCLLESTTTDRKSLCSTTFSSAIPKRMFGERCV